jgi:hypothetical protein
MLEGEHVDVLEKSEAERVVDLVERTDDGAREVLVDEWLFGHAGTCSMPDETYVPFERTRSIGTAEGHPRDPHDP